MPQLKVTTKRSKSKDSRNAKIVKEKMITSPVTEEKTKVDTGKTLKRLAGVTSLALLGAYATKNIHTKKDASESHHEGVLKLQESKDFCAYLNKVIETNLEKFKEWDRLLSTSNFFDDDNVSFPNKSKELKDLFNKRYFFSPERVKKSLNDNFKELITLLEKNENMIPVLVIPVKFVPGFSVGITSDIIKQTKMDWFFSLLFLREYNNHELAKKRPIEHAFISFKLNQNCSFKFSPLFQNNPNVLVIYCNTFIFDMDINIETNVENETYSIFLRTIGSTHIGYDYITKNASVAIYPKRELLLGEEACKNAVIGISYYKENLKHHETDYYILSKDENGGVTVSNYLLDIIGFKDEPLTLIYFFFWYPDGRKTLSSLHTYTVPTNSEIINQEIVTKISKPKLKEKMQHLFQLLNDYKLDLSIKTFETTKILPETKNYSLHKSDFFMAMSLPTTKIPEKYKNLYKN
jgi:hypothetical protein